MALDFPSSPTNGQVYDNYYYDSILGAWRSAGTKNGLSTRLTTLENITVPAVASRVTTLESTTIPAIATRTTALETADNTTNKSGLVPIIPTSVSVNSGTGSVSATGLITWNAANTLTVNNVFSSAYTNYKLVMTTEGDSNPSDIWFQFKNSGGTLATGYNFMRFNNTGGATSASAATSQNSWNLGRTNGGGGTAIEVTIFYAGASLTGSNGYRKYISLNTDAFFSEYLSGVNGTAPATYTGCVIFFSSPVTAGNGRLRIYGFRD